MYKRMLMLAAAALLAIAAQAVSRADTIELHNGRTITVDKASFDGTTFVLPGGEKIPLSEVRKYNVGVKTEKAPEKKKAAPGDVQALLAEAKRAEKLFPRAKCITLIDTGVSTRRPDGSHLYHYHGAVLIRHRDKLELANKTFGEEENRYRKKIIMVRSIAPDGTVYELDRSTIKKSKLSREGAFYGRGTQYSFTIPGVRVGSIIDYIYEYDTYNPYDRRMFFPGWYFGSEEPVMDSCYTVTVPKGYKMFWVYLNMPEDKCKPRVTTTADTVSWTWHTREMPGIIKEPDMPDLGDILPRLEGFPFDKGDWKYIVSWAGAKMKTRMESTKEIKDIVKKCTDGAATEEEKIAALYYFVQRDIGYVSIKGSTASGMFGHPAAHTLKNGYGDCIDKAILFATLLSEAGITAYPIWINTNDRATEITEYPTIGGNHAINEIHQGGRVYFLDATAEFANYRFPFFRSDDHGVAAINPMLGTITPIPVPAPEMNARTTRADLEVLPNGGVNMSLTNTFTGDEEAGWRGWFEKADPERVRQWFQQFVNSNAPGSKIRSCNVENKADVSKPFRMTLDFLMPGYATRAGGLFIFNMPIYGFNFPEAGLEKRRYDLRYSTSLMRSHHYRIRIPDNFTVRFVPKPLEIKNPHASYSASYTVNGNSITFASTFKRKDRIIPAADYGEYRKFLQTVKTYSKGRVFLEEKTAKPEE